MANSIKLMGSKQLGFVVSAPRKSSGKTTLTLGLASALTGRGVSTRVFKKGPDYIDPMWHKAATGLACYNLDPFWMSDADCQALFTTRGREVDLSIVEGNHGLHDGLDLKGSNSTAHLAKILKLPVILVVDATGRNRGVAATVLGHQKLDPELTIGGVVLNNISTQRQAQKQIAAIEYYCDVPVVGTLPDISGIKIKERHLGLTTIHEIPVVEKILGELASAVSRNCDLDAILSLAGSREITRDAETVSTSAVAKKGVTIGVAFDKSFCFYYQDNFEALRREGAELIFFDTMRDTCLPPVDAVYIGGGFPESFLPELERNSSFRQDLSDKIELGLPVYAECGGLMYLTRSIERNGMKKQMVGVLPADVMFYEKPVGKGYSELSDNNQKSWFKIDRVIKGHEFHYSKLYNLSDKISYNFNVKRGTGITTNNDGIIHKNVVALYSHIHALPVPEWAPLFVEAARQWREGTI